MKKNILLLVFILIFTKLNFAQSVTIDPNTATNGSAIIKAQSTSSGTLIPNVTTSQRTVIASPQKGLLVFDTDTGTFWFHNGTTWIQLVGGTSNWTPYNSNTELSSNNYARFSLGNGTNTTALASGVGTEGTLKINSPSPLTASRYLSLDGNSIQARRINVVTDFKTENNLLLNPFGGNIGVGLGSFAPTAKLHLRGDTKIDGTTYSSIFNNGSTEDTYIRGGKFGSTLVLNDIPNANILMGGSSNNKVGINITPGVGLDINGAVAYRSTTYTLTANVSYESISTFDISYIIIIANQSTNGINLADGIVVGQQLLIQLKTNILSIFFPLSIPDNPTLTNINLSTSKVMVNNSLLKLIWDGTDWQEIAFSSNN